MTLNELFEAAKTLACFCYPEKGWYSGQSVDDEGVSRDNFNHWSGALAELKVRLGRRLTEAEVCVLSLALDYGPTPGMNTMQNIRYMTLLWPQINHKGGFWSPLKLIEKLAGVDGEEEIERKAWEENKDSLIARFGPDTEIPEPLTPRHRRSSYRVIQTV